MPKKKDLHIIVTIKQVPDTHEVRIDPKTNSLIREGVPSIVNPEDRNAVEAALQLREKHGGQRYGADHGAAPGRRRPCRGPCHGS